MMRLLDSVNDETMPYRQLSDDQEKLLAILPIPSAVLSVCGGLLMITAALRSRGERPWTPYQGLMTSLSFCNILASLTVASGAFLYPSETSNQVWALGNNTSCMANGFFGQFGTSALLYNGMLSYFFLLRLRFEHHVNAITVKFEPLMHIVSLGYPLVTSFLGLFFDAYGERVGSTGCAIRTCPINQFTGEREACMLHTVDLVFRRCIDFFVILSMLMNTIIITSHLKTVIEKHTRKSAESAKRASALEEGNITVSEELIRQRKAKVEESLGRAKFKKGELLQVKLQGAFFIGSYVICNFATIILQMIVAQKSKGNMVDEMEVPVKYFGLMVLQAILFPLLGFLNCIAYMKPSLARTRHHNRGETWWWVFCRTVLGSSVQPTMCPEGMASSSKPSIMKNKNNTKRGLKKIKKSKMNVSFRMHDESEEDGSRIGNGLQDEPVEEEEDIEKLEGSGTDETSGSDHDSRDDEEAGNLR